MFTLLRHVREVLSYVSHETVFRTVHQRTVMTIWDCVHPLNNFWFDGEPPNKVENIMRLKKFEMLEELELEYALAPKADELERWFLLE